MTILVLAIAFSSGLFLAYRPKNGMVILTLALVWLSPQFVCGIFGLSYAERGSSVPGVAPWVWLALGMLAGSVRLHNLQPGRPQTKDATPDFFVLIPGAMSAFAVLLTFLTTMTFVDIGSVSLVLETLIGPLCLSAACYRLSRDSKFRIDSAIKAFTYSMLAQSLLATLQYLTQNLTLYRFVARDQTWLLDAMVSHQKLRGCGTMDHPIILGLTCAAAMLMIPGVTRKISLRIPAAICLMSGALASGSRAAAVLAGIAFMYLLAFTSRNIIQRAGYGLLLATVLSTTLVNLVLGRLTSDNGSLSLRQRVYTQALSSIGDFTWSGLGPGHSREYVANNFGVGISLESFPLIWIYDYGLVAGTLLCCSLGILAFAKHNKVGNGVTLAFRVMLLGSITYSSLAVKSQSIWIFTLILIMNVTSKHYVQDSPRVGADNPRVTT